MIASWPLLFWHPHDPFYHDSFLVPTTPTSFLSGEPLTPYYPGIYVIHCTMTFSWSLVHWHPCDPLYYDILLVLLPRHPCDPFYYDSMFCPCYPNMQHYCHTFYSVFQELMSKKCKVVSSYIVDTYVYPMIRWFM